MDINAFIQQFLPAYAVFRFVFIAFDILLVVGVLYYFFKIRSLRPKFGGKPSYHERRLAMRKDSQLPERWAAIVKKFNLHPPQSYSLGIIEADTFVDDILKRVGIAGETFADRLRQLDPDEIPSLSRLWRVHRIRNALVHSPNFTVSQRDAEEAFAVYESFLRDIEVL